MQETNLLVQPALHYNKLFNQNISWIFLDSLDLSFQNRELGFKFIHDDYSCLKKPQTTSPFSWIQNYPIIQFLTDLMKEYLETPKIRLKQ